MASLATMQGTGRVRVPSTSGTSYTLTRREQEEIIGQVIAEHYPHYRSQALAMNAMAGDPRAAQYVAEATAAYKLRQAAAPAPAAPAAVFPTTSARPAQPRARKVYSV